MTTADFFVLDVLRGWRLLQATSLNREEWRDILSATNSMLDFDSISNALQVLWDEQLMQPRSSHHQPISAGSRRTTPGLGMMIPAWWADAQWNDVQPSWDADLWWQDYEQCDDTATTAAEPNELSPAELEDPQIHEALQSEKIAENLKLASHGRRLRRQTRLYAKIEVLELRCLVEKVRAQTQARVVLFVLTLDTWLGNAQIECHQRGNVSQNIILGILHLCGTSHTITMSWPRAKASSRVHTTRVST
jgi:hypothetical protein